MIKVLYRKIKTWQTTCHRCHTRFQFDEDDIYKMNGEGTVFCPTCNNGISHRYWDEISEQTASN